MKKLMKAAAALALVLCAGCSTQQSAQEPVEEPVEEYDSLRFLDDEIPEFSADPAEAESSDLVVRIIEVI